MNLKEKLDLPIFETIAKVAAKRQTPVYAVGGFVRDTLLQRPIKDIDFVTLGSGIDLASDVAKELNLENSLTVFKNFGTAMIKWKKYEIEFVGARKESYRRGSRKPIVEDGTIEDDQKRRDFTINAMSISLQEENYGEVIDPFDGLKDLDEKRIKTPLAPDQTYSDDPLRMMRAIRFATQLHFGIEKESLEAISRNKERIQIISQERIADELNKILAAPNPSIGFDYLYKTGLLAIILPEIQALQGVEEIDGQSHKDNFYHTIEVVDNISENTQDLWLRWAALLHDIGKPVTKRFDDQVGWTFHGHEFIGSKMVPRVFKRLRMPLNDKMRFVQKMVMLSSRPAALTSDDTTDSAVRRLLFDAGDDIDSLMTLVEADITSKNANRVKRYRNNFKEVRGKLKAIEEKDKIRNFQPPISGDEIISTFNLRPCKEIGLIKNAIKDAILDGEIPNEYQAAREFMLRKGAELGLNQTS
ncbi:HD domain-containing protein [bacterium SCSIO 12741]|nr:HD domain-containing protein [bacterium SCSIO 12741]